MKNRTMLTGVLMLAAVTVCSGYLLAQAYRSTRPRIEHQQKVEAERMNREIFPEAVTFQAAGDPGTEYVSARDASGTEVGRIRDVRVLGYGGIIVVKTGVDRKGRITRVKILQHNETPGLGAKITQEGFLRQFAGKEQASLRLRKDNPEGTIDAITGATISSRAVTDGIRNAMGEVPR